jgi:hypothetical protein
VVKERFNYAWVLVATSSYEIINCFESILVDGVMVKVKIIEEWGFNIGDDACLYDEVDVSHEDQSQQEDFHFDPGHDINNDCLVDNLVNDLVESERHGKSNDDLVDLDDNDNEIDECTGSPTIQDLCHNVSSAASVQPVLSKECVDQSVNCTPKTVNTEEPSIVAPLGLQLEELVANSGCQEAVPQTGVISVTKKKSGSVRATSCPPREDRSVLSGPWSLEWPSD